MYPYFRAITDHDCTQATVGGRRVIMVGSNNYLGLTHDPRVVEAAQQATARFGTSCTGSRFFRPGVVEQPDRDTINIYRMGYAGCRHQSGRLPRY